MARQIKRITKFTDKEINTPLRKKGEASIYYLDNDNLALEIGQKYKTYKYEGVIRNEYGKTKSIRRSIGYVKGYNKSCEPEDILTIYDAQRRVIDVREGKYRFEEEKFFYDGNTNENNELADILNIYYSHREDRTSYREIVRYAKKMLEILQTIKPNKLLIHTITTQDMRLTMNAYKDEYEAKTSQNHFYTHCKAFFNWAVDEGYIDSNPVTFKAPNKKNSPSTKWYSVPEVYKIIGATKHMGFPYKYVPQIHLLTLRRQETVVQWKWSDIRWKEKLLRSRKEIEKIDTCNLDVPLSDKAIQLLKEIQAKQKALGITSDYIFAYPADPLRPIHPHNHKNSLVRMIKKLTGFDDYKASHLRHTSRTHLSRLQVRPEVASYIGGWAKTGDAGSTIYTNDDFSYGGEVYDAVNKLAELFYPKLEVSSNFKKASEEENKNAPEHLQKYLLDNGSDPETVQKFLKARSEMIEFNGIKIQRDILANFISIYEDDRIQSFLKYFQRYLWSYSDTDFERMNKLFSPEIYHLMSSTPMTFAIPERYDYVCNNKDILRQKRAELRYILPFISELLFLKKSSESNPDEALKADHKKDYRKKHAEIFEMILLRSNIEDYADLEDARDDKYENIETQISRYLRKLQNIHNEHNFSYTEFSGLGIIEFSLINFDKDIREFIIKNLEKVLNNKDEYFNSEEKKKFEYNSAFYLFKTNPIDLFV